MEIKAETSNAEYYSSKSDLLKSANAYYFQGKYQEAIKIWLGCLDSVGDASASKIHGYLGAAYQQSGQLQLAVKHFLAAIEINKDLNLNSDNFKVDLAQVYNNLRQPQNAIPLLNEVISSLTNQNNTAVSTAALNILGTSYLIQGNYDKAIDTYKDCFKLAKEDSKTGILNNLTTAYTRSLSEKQKLSQLADSEGDKETANQALLAAQKAQRNAIQTANDAVATSNRSDIVSAVAMIKLMQLTQNDNYTQDALKILEKLPSSRDKAYAYLNLAQLQPPELAVTFFKKAHFISEEINDLRTTSEALGNLGKLYEKTQPFIALSYTQEAQSLAQQVQAFDLLARWLWQAGRIYFHNGKTQEAITAYKEAVGSLQTIRQGNNKNGEESSLDYATEVEPVYRGLISLLLKSDEPRAIKEALSVFELLQISEVQEFFGDNCIIADTQVKQEPASDTAVIYSIIQETEIYLILLLPNGQTFKYWLPITKSEIESLVKQARVNLEDISSNRYLEQSQSLYALLMGKIENVLKTSNISTILFISDGVLRNIPYSALHDGKQFLVEKYAIANSLGKTFSLKLVEPSANLEPLIFGISKAIPPFSALPYVEKELYSISKLKSSQIFLNQDFFVENLEKQLLHKKYSLLHIATHGKFGGSAQSSFLQAIDGQINISDLQQILATTNNLDLLTLSGCQTAAGNERSVLGLSGMAIRTGVKSVVGSLWLVNDSVGATLITDFYSGLFKDNLNRAEALRVAQLKQIAQNKAHPATWSNFILLGSW